MCVCVCLEKERDRERREKVTDSSIETDLMQKVGWDWGGEKKYVKEKISDLIYLLVTHKNFR